VEENLTLLLIHRILSLNEQFLSEFLEKEELSLGTFVETLIEITMTYSYLFELSASILSIMMGFEKKGDTIKEIILKATKKPDKQSK
jgi:hypothetical protein